MDHFNVVTTFHNTAVDGIVIFMTMPDGLPYGLNASAIIEQLKEAHDGLKHAP
jgi:hypothetical protein